jgi:hypothetical protein
MTWRLYRLLSEADNSKHSCLLRRLLGGIAQKTRSSKDKNAIRITGLFVEGRLSLTDIVDESSFNSTGFSSTR